MKKLLTIGLSLGLAAVLLTGCGSNSTAPNTLHPDNANRDVVGVAYGGRQPIVGAHLYMYAAGGYGPSTATTEQVSLILPGDGVNRDPSTGNYYVTTGPGGTFDLTGKYLCSQGQEVWLYSIGGQPEPNITNPVAGITAVLGKCPSYGTFAGQISYIYMNEVSTVAMAYAVAGYAYDATHISAADQSQSTIGVANAFANANQLYDIQGSGLTTGARSVTPNGNGTVPQTLLNSLANVIAACVDSVGMSSGACTNLFKYAPSTSVDTASAAIYIAQHPGSNTDNILNIQQKTAPWQPSLSSKPDSLDISITFSGFSSPNSVAIDTAGNVWVDDFGNSDYLELSPLGVPLAGGTTYPTLISGPRSIVTDQAGDTWVNNFNAGTIVETIGNGTPVQ